VHAYQWDILKNNKEKEKDRKKLHTQEFFEQEKK